MISSFFLLIRTKNLLSDWLAYLFCLEKEKKTHKKHCYLSKRASEIAQFSRLLSLYSVFVMLCCFRWKSTPKTKCVVVKLSIFRKFLVVFFFSQSVSAANFAPAFSSNLEFISLFHSLSFSLTFSHTHTLFSIRTQHSHIYFYVHVEFIVRLSVCLCVCAFHFLYILLLLWKHPACTQQMLYGTSSKAQLQQQQQQKQQRKPVKSNRTIWMFVVVITTI